MPRNPRVLLFPSLLAACQVGGPAAVETCDLSVPHAVVATTDFQVGVLAVLTAEGCVADQISATSGDAVVRATSERLWVINRTGGDALVGYLHRDYRTPDLEIGDVRHDNPHDLVRVGDQLFVSRWEHPALAVFDAGDGRLLGEIDLSAEADADGVPEADAMVVLDGQVYVALQRLDADSLWAVPGGAGRVVRIDPDSWAVTGRWETGVNPKMSLVNGQIQVISGTYFEADGALEVIDDDIQGEAEPILGEAEVGLDFGDTVGGVLLGTTFDVEDSEGVVGCLRDGAYREALRTKGWYSDAVDATELGLGVLVGAREGFEGHGAAGLWSVDADGCSVQEVAFPSLLAPFSMTVVP